MRYNDSLNVFWFKLNFNNGNFGDELNSYLINKLSSKKIVRVIIPESGLSYIYKSFQFLWRTRQFELLPRLFRGYFKNDFIVGIGSVLSQINSPKCKVWGSGIISKNDIVNPARYHAVRGKFSQKRLMELNITPPVVIGDPAILLPLVYNKKVIPNHLLGVIPHYIHFDVISKSLNDDKLNLINLTESIEKVIDQIKSCKFIISTSLHGIIVSHAYGIPSLWVDGGHKKLGGDDVKFLDYFSSVGINAYKPFALDFTNFDIENIINFFNENESLSNVDKGKIYEIQKKLIDCAPFNVLDEYRIS